MKRIFFQYAYGNGPRSECWWDTMAEIAANSVLKGEISCDVVIVGAGFTGLSAAYHLARAGASVAILEANSVGWGASGRNGGFCCLGGAKASDAALDRRVGQAGRIEWRQTEKAAVALVDTLLSDLALDVDRHSMGETCLAHRPRDARSFDRQCARVEENYGVTPDVLASDELSSAGMSGPFHGAMTIPVGFALNPRKFVAGMLAAAVSEGARVFDQSAVTKIDSDGVSTALGRVSAKQVILATNGYSSEDVPPAMAGRYMPAQSTVIVTRPLEEAELAAQGWTSDQMAYDSRNLLHYFRLMPDRRFLFGMRGGILSSDRSEAASRARVIRDFRNMFPAWADVAIPHVWSGLVCLTRGLVPFAGPLGKHPNVLAGFAYHGNGVAMGTHTGKVLAELALGQKPDLYPRVMKDPARRFPLSGLRRALMPPLYALYALDDFRP
ncbi:NAD(P)/FAD-dependent oxidoreductase [Tateyamaria armeniaca]|uniref:NAD(P)/FAD-dependent oxidoreductase n=1 Tax=Tateyamaria armeniaca TaxID=2518930 RepID=A0ABW8URF1_9RHOB